MKNLVSKGREIANGSREEFEAIYVEDARDIKKEVNDSPPFTANSTRPKLHLKTNTIMTMPALFFTGK